jgi:hypothetical protein
MPSADQRLRIFLRIVGVWTLLALPAVFMPKAWMVSTHEWLGLGEFPDTPLMQTLARMVSAFYAFFGAACLFLADDPPRYRPLARFLGKAVALFGIALLGISQAAGMPLWWTAAEGPPTIAIGAVMFLLARHDHQTDP